MTILKLSRLDLVLKHSRHILVLEHSRLNLVLKHPRTANENSGSHAHKRGQDETKPVERVNKQTEGFVVAE
jgi:hypothetical protein